MKVYTTGQVARICKVAPRTVSKWFDSGRLKGYRIPGSQDRRIPANHLADFLRDNGMPLGPLTDDADITARVFVLSEDGIFIAALVAELGTRPFWQIASSGNPFEAGMGINEMQPDAVVVDFAIGAPAARGAIASLREQFGDAVLVIALRSDAEIASTSAGCKVDVGIDKSYELEGLAAYLRKHVALPKDLV